MAWILYRLLQNVSVIQDGWLEIICMLSPGLSRRVVRRKYDFSEKYIVSFLKVEDKTKQQISRCKQQAKVAKNICPYVLAKQNYMVLGPRKSSSSQK
jgi:hypothetical protein